MLTVLILLCCISLLNYAQADPGSYTVALNLHKAASITTINTKSSAGQIFNSTSSWSGSTQENSSEFAAGAYWSVYFYMYPILAGTLALNGAVTVTSFLKANASIADATLITTLNKISAAGARTQISTKSDGSVALSASYVAKTSSHGSVSASVASDFTLELNITVGGSASNLTAYVGYDTAAANSRVSLVATDPLAISLSSDRDTYERDEGATLMATVTDVFGGYDISSAPTITFTFPNGVTCTTSASSTGDTQYTNTYTYSFTKLSSSGESGTWIATATVSDQNSNSYTSSSDSFSVITDPGGFNWDTDKPLQTTPTDPVPIPVEMAVVIAVIALATLGALAYKAHSKKRRRH